MTGIQSSNEVGAALMRGGLQVSVLDTDVFQAIWQGDRYAVYTDCLPDICIEKTLPMDSFHYRDEEWIALFAIEKVNRQRTPVTVIRSDELETVTFRYCFCPETADSLIRKLCWCFLQIDRAIESFGHACEAAIEQAGRETMEDLMEGLLDLTPDSPWIQGKMRS